MFNEILRLVCQVDFVFSIFRITAPILFAALAAVVAEKAGVVNIGLDGIMLISGLFGTLFSYWTQSWFIGVVGAMVIGLLLALMMGFFALKLKTDIILAGIAINTMSAGGTIFLLYVFTGERGNTASLTSSNILIPTVEIPGLSSIPVLGDILSGHSVLTYVAFILVFLTWVLLYKTSIGLQIRAVGENDHAADSVGISVLKIKYIALGISGILAGMGGSFLSMYYSQSWNTGVVAGRGFIALAAQAMGHGEPVGTMFASLLFGFAQALRTKVSGIQGVSSNLISAMPYAVTIIGLVLYAMSTINKAKRKKAQMEKRNANKEEKA